jgi:hypothetical protein
LTSSGIFFYLLISDCLIDIQHTTYNTMLRVISSSSRLCCIGGCTNPSKSLCSPAAPNHLAAEWIFLVEQRHNIKTTTTTIAVDIEIDQSLVSCRWRFCYYSSGWTQILYDHFGGTGELWRSASFYSYAYRSMCNTGGTKEVRTMIYDGTC